MVEEHGDVLTEARRTAEATRITAARVLDWSDLLPTPEDEASEQAEETTTTDRQDQSS